MERSRDYNLARACVSWAERNLAEFVLKTDAIQTMTVYTTGSSAKYSKVISVDLSPDVSLYDGHLYQATQYVDLGILPNSWAMGLETAYVEACKSLPQAATNMAANILEAASTLANIWHGNFGALLPDNPKDAWLAYRYVYTTTKLDVAELKSISSRLSALATSNRIAVYGSYTRGNTKYRVGFDIDTAQILPKEVSTTLQKFGLRLNALNVWDMIPYSFVVDWFLPISNIIEYFQDLSACRYEPQDLWWSITTVNDTVTSYSRLPGRKLHTLPYLQLSPTSNKTIFMRIADSVALFT
jgi:predicted nucleotidyltransferase